MYAVTVTFKLRPGTAPRFLELVRTNAAASLRDEPGCHRFDVCHAEDRPDEVFLYELYGTRADFDAHLATPHFARFDDAIGDLVEDKHIALYEQVWT
ncbi:putative quinol monooxygenase [Aestuariicoccus sp. MJ-SS9]|uniref:putative quinol monooxygenase n=1 Tax=Aestuariicoccus sp. MJ-SS9 TaxID=3079855 RepID=UPI00290E8DFD|nr:putative quinol monooxygenase [Aestuariicoccus sp. MJ-SS9]MDU8910309.1 putative quinol monooxygenase [Aestuariicoccus sp. MJ-SS9]